MAKRLRTMIENPFHDTEVGMRKSSRILLLALLFLAAAAVSVGLQACGKKDGDGTGGNVTFNGAGA